MKKSKQLALRKKGLMIETYGYAFNKKDLYVILFVLSVVMLIIGYLHKLSSVFITLTVITVVFAIPILISAYFKYKYERKRFEEYCRYFEYMKVYYKTYKKVSTALKKTREQFESNSMMYKCITLAIDEIDNSGDIKKALDYIYDKYGNSYLDRLHECLRIGEKHGADNVYDNIDMINYDKWKERVKLMQKNKGTLRVILLITFVICMGISAFFVHILMGINANLDLLNVYQIYTFIELELIYFISVFMFVGLTNKAWIRRDV